MSWLSPGCFDCYLHARAKLRLMRLPTLATPVSTGVGGGSGGGSFDNNGDGKVTCADFTTQAQAYEALQAGYTNLDGDGDGEPCENL